VGDDSPNGWGVANREASSSSGKEMKQYFWELGHENKNVRKKTEVRWRK
jgi:hypothetical protein